MTSALRSSARHLRSALTTTASAFAAGPALPRAPCIAGSLESAASLPRVPQNPARSFSLAPPSHASPPPPASPAASDLPVRFQLASCAPRLSISAQGAPTVDRIAGAGRSAPQVSQPSISRSSLPRSFGTFSAQRQRLSTLAAFPRALAAGPVPSPASAVPSLRAHDAVVAARAAGAGQARGVFVEVKKGDVDRAIKKFKIKLRADNAIRVARARSHHWKGAELKRLRAKEAEIRRQQQDFRQKLAWIMAKRARGF
ncbi:unnamed protein product [Closterium sp. NIES-53]